MKKYVKIIISTLSLIFFALTVYLLVSNVVSMRKNKPVSIFGYSFSYVPTKSMESTIKAGDMILFRDFLYENLQEQDIIIYRSKAGETRGIYIVHRIVEVTDEGFIVKGDNNPSNDSEVVTKDMYIGKYVKVVNFFNISKIISNKNVIFMILILIIFSIIVMEIVNIYSISAKEKLKNTEENIKKELLEEIKKELLEEIEQEKNKKT